MKLSAALGKQLDTAEQKVTLMLKDEAGEPVGQAFSPEGNDNEI